MVERGLLVGSPTAGDVTLGARSNPEEKEIGSDPTSITVARVFVLDKDGLPLMPYHPARARKLLGSGRARVHYLVPFAIRLVDRTVADSVVEGVEVGIDSGSRLT